VGKKRAFQRKTQREYRISRVGKKGIKMLFQKYLTEPPGEGTDLRWMSLRGENPVSRNRGETY